MKKWGPEEQTVLERQCGNVFLKCVSLVSRRHIYFQLQHFFFCSFTQLARFAHAVFKVAP